MFRISVSLYPKMKTTKLHILTILFLFAITKVNAQINLVPNGDFEIYSSLPTTYGQSNLAVGWNNINGDYTNIKGSPDYYNVISFSALGSITPFSGNCQMGFVTIQIGSIFREYISTKFIGSMISGHHYSISFNLTNGIDTFYTKNSNNIGIHFSNSPLYQAMTENISVIPQIEITNIINCWNVWKHYSFNYTSDSSYQYITIGNFKDDAHTLVSSGNIGAYYFIDKIEIYPAKVKIEGDSLICKNDTISLVAVSDTTVKWAYAIKPDSIISTNAVLNVKLDITTTYVVYGNNNDTAWFTVNVINPPMINLGNDTTICIGKDVVLNPNINNAIYQWQDNSTNSTYKVNYPGVYWVKATIPPHCSNTDTIIIYYQNCETGGIYIPNAFTPNGDGLNDIFKVETVIELKEFKLMIFDRTGELIFESSDISKGWDGTFKGKAVPMGVYVYTVKAIIKDSNELINREGIVTVLR